MTGIAIVLYLNQTPAQPRERDYAYAGSFYAFSIWIGMGVAGLIQWCSRLKPQKRLIDGATEEEAEKIRKTLEAKRATFITKEEEEELEDKLASLYETYIPFNPTPAVAGLASDRKSTRLNSSPGNISYAGFCLKKIPHTSAR